jgi:NAD(P)-dependent dehydrogenase (short-subunit alcohol dehydrogenase family)
MTWLVGAHALVTGGTSGIGAACARALADAGAAVVACGRRVPTGVLVPPVAGAVVRAHLDVTDDAAVAATIAAFPALDVLVCAAGDATFAPIAQAHAADLRAMLDTHVVGAFLCARAALAQMVPRRRGHIVIVGSHAATRAFPDCGGYTAAKAGQLGLARVLAEEARPHDVRVTCVMPGATDTPIWDSRPDFDRRKMMRADDVAAFIVHLVANRHLAIGEVVVTPPAGAL